MTGQTLLVFIILAVTIILFASELLRLDVTAILVVLALMLTNILSPIEALSGFGDPLILLIAGLFVVGEGLFRTGVAFRLSNWVTQAAGASETRLLVLLMLVVAGLSAFMSSTGAVAIFIPVAINLAAKAKISPARLLMPIAIASLIGGMLTLIGTPPNLVVSTELFRNNLTPFRFFDFTPIGLLVLAAGIAYVVLVGRKLLPQRDPEQAGQARLSIRDLAEAYELLEQMHYLRLKPGSSLAGRTVAQTQVRRRYGVTLLSLERTGRGYRAVIPILPQTELRAGDTLYVAAPAEKVEEFIQNEGLTRLKPGPRQEQRAAQELGLVEVLLTPRSQLIGHTLKDIRFRDRFGLTVLGILRKGRPLKDDLINTPFTFGDSLLMAGSWRQIDLLQKEHRDFLVLTLPREISEVAPQRAKAPVAIAIIASMLVLMTFGLVPNVAAALLAALAMVLSGCLSMKDAYGAINWQSLVLIAGMLPMAQALEKTGGAQLIVDQVGVLGDMGPMALMAGLFLITSLLSQVISNTATTVLVAPIALRSAQVLGISPYPVLMTVAIAASTAFATPVSTPVNTLILGPGGYRFNDFLKVGLPLILVSLLITLLAVPLVFPLY